MKAEDLLFALDGVRDESVFRAGERLERRNAVRPRRYSVRALLIAAALVFALAGIGWYVYRSAMTARIPDDGGIELYRAVSFAEGEDKPISCVLHHTALSIRVDTEAESRLCLFRAPARESALGTRRKTLYSLLDESDSVGKMPDIRLSMEEGLRQAGMNRYKAAEFCTYWADLGGEPTGVPRLSIELFNACELYGTELILTTEEGTAEIVKQEENGICDRLEVIYRGRLEVNYLFQYVPEKQILLVICGDAAEYDFPALEEAADGLQIRQTELVVPRYEESYEDWRTIEQPEIWLRDDEP